MRTTPRLRRARLGALLLLAATCVAVSTPASVTSPAAASAASASADKPNIVLFLLDDATVEDMRYMPKTRRLLGGAGMTFTNMVSQNPTCCPARAQIVTAQLDHNNGVLTNQGIYGGIRSLRDPENTLGAWLNEAGYRSAVYGKYLNSYDRSRDGVPPGWDVWDPALVGGTNYRHFATATECPDDADVDCIRETSEQRRYTTHVMRDKVLARIEEWSNQQEPFFIYASWVAPHKNEKGTGGGQGDRGVPKAETKYADTYAGVRNPAFAKPSFNEDDMSDKTADMRRWKKEPNFRSATQKDFLGRARSLRSVDDAVEATVERLKTTGEFDDTVFLFTSDNGYLNGEHRLRYKKWAFVESLRVPLIMTGPDIPKGRETSRWVTMVDLAATILDASGAVSHRRSVDGQSFLSTRPGNDYNPRPLLIGSGRETAKTRAYKNWAYRGVMWGRYIWTKHWGDAGAVLGEQFYDLNTDPYQINSRPEAAKFKGVIRKMKALYLQTAGCAGAGCIVPPRRVPQPR